MTETIELNGRRYRKPARPTVIICVDGFDPAYVEQGIGDGILPNPGTEKIVETYYQFPLLAGMVSFDYQFIVNPAYNRDRGPASVIGTRWHAEF